MDGLKRLVQKCRKEFRRKENLAYYDHRDLKVAERKYIQFCLTGDPGFSRSGAGGGGTMDTISQDDA